MLTELLISLDFVVALVLPKPPVGGGDEREAPQVALSVGQVPTPPLPTKPSPAIRLLPADEPASSQSQEVRVLWGQVEGQQDPEPSGCLFLGACGHCRPCWVYTAVLADRSPVAAVQSHPCARGPLLATGQSFDAKGSSAQCSFGPESTVLSLGEARLPLPFSSPRLPFSGFPGRRRGGQLLQEPEPTLKQKG